MTPTINGLENKINKLVHHITTTQMPNSEYQKYTQEIDELESYLRILENNKRMDDLIF